MITPLESYFLYQAERPRTRAEQQADDARSAGFIASFTRGPAARSGRRRGARARAVPFLVPGDLPRAGGADRRDRC